MKKKFLSILLTLALVVTMVPVLGITANAAVTKYVAGETGLTSAVKSGEEIKLLANIKLSKALIIDEDKNVTIDLNGYVLEGSGDSCVVANAGTLTIKDSGTRAHYFKVNEDGLWTLTGKTKADYIFDITNGLRKDGKATSDIPAAGAVIKVSGGAITGGKAQSGGGIYNKGTLYLYGGSIVGNMAYGDTMALGGGMCVDGGIFDMSGGAILGNVASSAAGAGVFGFGGGIVVFGGNADIRNSILQANAAYMGGACAVMNGSYDYNGVLNVKESIIRGNQANGYGGAIFGVYYKTLNIEDSVIEDNRACFGGGLFYQSSEFEPTVIKNSAIRGNIAGEGGGMAVFSSTTIENSIIEKNLAETSGGGIDIEYFYEEDYDEAEEIDAKEAFEILEKTEAVLMTKSGNDHNTREAAKAFVSIKDSVVKENSAQWGGGICNNGPLKIIDSSIIDNTITNTNSEENWKTDFGGAGIDFYYGSITVSGKVIISDNTTNGAKDNLFMEFCEKQNNEYFENIPLVIGEDRLKMGSKIGITHMMEPTADAPVQLTNAITNLDYFFSDDAKYHIQKNAENTCLELAVGATESTPKTFIGKLISGLLSIEGLEWMKELSSKAFKLFKEFLIFKTA